MMVVLALVNGGEQRTAESYESTQSWDSIRVDLVLGTWLPHYDYATTSELVILILAAIFFQVLG